MVYCPRTKRMNGELYSMECGLKTINRMMYGYSKSARPVRWRVTLMGEARGDGFRFPGLRARLTG